MAKPEVRPPAVAGHFYPASPKELREEVSSFLTPSAPKTDCLGCIMPHAGYTYSGAVAGATASRLKPKDVIFLVGPNHTGYGTPFSVMASGAWETPLGRVPVNGQLAECLVSSSDIFAADATAHLMEHSLEVELPFLQEAMDDFSIVPLTIASDREAGLFEAGERIAGLIEREGLRERALIVASSDMTHYEPREEARKKDMAAIDAVLALDPAKLLQVVRQKEITMCGYAPSAVMLTAVKKLGARKAELVKYMTSGDVTGDTTSVVGYAGIIVY